MPVQIDRDYFSSDNDDEHKTSSSQDC